MLIGLLIKKKRVAFLFLVSNGAVAGEGEQPARRAARQSALLVVGVHV